MAAGAGGLNGFTAAPPRTGTTKRDVAVLITPDRLTVSLSWAGRVLDGPLAKRVRAADAVWALGDAPPAGGAPSTGLLPPPPPRRPATGGGGGDAGGGGGAQPPPGCVDLMVVLPKAEGGRFWKSLFEGGPEKSHWEVRGGLHAAAS